MENIDVLVLRTLHAWLRAGHAAALVTVVRTWGSSPRPMGSVMALRDDGAVVGSVSGGCIEDDLIHRYAAGPGRRPTQVLAGPPQLVRYGVSAAEAHRFGLPCGGTLELLIEPSPDPQTLGLLLQSLDMGRLVRRHVSLADGRSSMGVADAPAELVLGETELVATFGPEYRVLLIGAGQLSEYLATMAIFNGFRVSVCDPREEHLGSWSVAGVELLRDMPDDVVRDFRPDRRSGVVALTHDPKLDDLALLEALNSPAFYVGAIGSRRNNQARRQRLREHFGIDEQSLARLRGPIGLHIGSKTPPEIAVSVMAELIAVRNGITLSPDLDVASAKDRLAEAGTGTVAAADGLACVD